jgi:acylphosphatase
VILKNGQAFLDAEGEEAQVADFREWCRTGPEGSFVESLVTIEKTVFGYDDFKIL